MPESTFWVRVDNLMRHGGSKVTPTFRKYYMSRFPHPPHSPDIRRCAFWLFGVFEGILQDQEFNPSDKIEEAITRISDDFTFDNAFQNWMSRLTWVIENGREYAH
jgi:hypothetical protein